MRTKKSSINYVSCTNCELNALCLPLEVAGKSIDLVEGILHRRQYIKKGEILFSSGDTFESFQCISSGSFKLLVPDEPKRIAGFCFSGELLDSGAIYAGTHCYDALALEDSYVCAIPKNAVEEISHQIPDFQDRIIKLISEQLFYANRLAIMLSGRRNADERLAAFLATISSRFQEHGFSAEQFHLSMVRDDIASYLGLAKDTVSRVLTRFHKQGLINYSGRYFEITGSEALHELADFPASAVS